MCAKKYILHVQLYLCSILQWLIILNNKMLKLLFESIQGEVRVYLTHGSCHYQAPLCLPSIVTSVFKSACTSVRLYVQDYLSVAYLYSPWPFLAHTSPQSAFW